METCATRDSLDKRVTLSGYRGDNALLVGLYKYVLWRRSLQGSHKASLRNLCLERRQKTPSSVKLCENQ